MSKRDYLDNTAVQKCYDTELLFGFVLLTNMKHSSDSFFQVYWNIIFLIGENRKFKVNAQFSNN